MIQRKLKDIYTHRVQNMVSYLWIQTGFRRRPWWGDWENSCWGRWQDVNNNMFISHLSFRRRKAPVPDMVRSSETLSVFILYVHTLITVWSRYKLQISFSNERCGTAQLNWSSLTSPRFTYFSQISMVGIHWRSFITDESLSSYAAIDSGPVKHFCTYK